ncbi:MAG: hypothetical protein FWG53_09345 [Clostridiales bacterium]|nr:hypothetical protein [Clostridiales bacterium]
MKKNILIVLICAVLTPNTVYANSVTVEIPSFPVSLNGQIFDNSYNQYPFIVYNDITYFPMAYNYAKFMRLKSNYYETERIQALFVGIRENADDKLIYYKTNIQNQTTYTATIPTYKIAVNSLYKFWANDNDEYPLLNFRNVTYFPLTWRFAVEEFGWQYSFDSIRGLRINIGPNPFRPIIDDRVLGFTSPNPGTREYTYSSNYYVGWPTSTFLSHKFIIRSRGNNEYAIDLTSLLSGADYYFGARAEFDDPQYPAISKDFNNLAYIHGNIFTIHCLSIKEGKYKNLWLQINLIDGNAVLKETL